MYLLKNTGRTLAALILVGGLAACGGNDGADEETTVEAKTEKPAEKASAKEAEAEVDGEMYAAVNDDRRKWYVTHLEDDGDWQSGSFWRAMSLKDTYQVTLFGLTNKAAKPSGKGDVMMSLVVQGKRMRGRRPQGRDVVLNDRLFALFTVLALHIQFGSRVRCNKLRSSPSTRKPYVEHVKLFERST